MPEGDSLHRAAARLQALVGERVEVETPHPRAQLLGLAARLDGRTLEAVEAVGKNLLLRFEGGLVLRSHLRMHGRWQLVARGAAAGSAGGRAAGARPGDQGRRGTPWLVLRGAEHEAVLWNGTVLELVREGLRLGPDILASLDTSPAKPATPGGKIGTPAASLGPPDYETMLARLRATPQEREVGDALLDQRLVAGIGNIWKAEALWEVRVSPWRPLAQIPDEELRDALEAAHRTMRASVGGGRARRHAYRRVNRPCPRCGTPIRSRPQGGSGLEAPAAEPPAPGRKTGAAFGGAWARTAYWCPSCQE